MSATKDDELAASVAAVDLNDQNAEKTQIPQASTTDTADTGDSMTAAIEAPAAVPPQGEGDDEFGEPVDLPPLEPKKRKTRRKKPASQRGAVRIHFSLCRDLQDENFTGLESDYHLRTNPLASRTFLQTHP